MQVLDLPKSNLLVSLNSLQQKLASPAWTIFLIPLRLSIAYHASLLHQQKHVQSFLFGVHIFLLRIFCGEDVQLLLHKLPRHAVVITSGDFDSVYTVQVKDNLHTLKDLICTVDILPLSWLSMLMSLLTDRYSNQSAHHKHTHVSA